MRALVLAAIAGSVLASARRAEACSCMPSAIARRTLPADGAVDVPLDARVRAVITGGLSDAVLDGLLSEYRLRDAEGRLVPVAASRQGSVLTWAPAAPLAPRARYVLERAYAYDARGDRLSDDDRWVAARVAANGREPPRRAAVRRWFPESVFTTGARGERALSRGPSVVAAAVAFAYGGGDCGPGIDLAIEYERGGLRTTDLLGVELEGLGVVAIVAHDDAASSPDGGRHRLDLGDTSCVPDPVHVPAREDLRVRLVALSIEGRAWPEPKFTAVTSPRPRSREVPAVAPRASEPAVAAAFFAPPLAEPSAREASASAGPDGCPYGLERAAVWPLPAGTVAWMWGARPSAGPRGATVYESAAGGAVRVDVDAAGRVRRVALPGVGDAAVAALDEDDTWVASAVGASTVRVGHYDRAGRARWSRDIADDGGTGWPQLAVGAGRVLVAWVTKGRDRVAWALLSAIDGATIAGGAVGARSLDTAFAVAFDGRTFVLAWTPREDAPAVQWARVSAEGKQGAPERVDGPRAAGLAWAVGARGLALAAVFGERRVELVPLDGEQRSTRLDARGVERASAPAVAVSGALTYVAWRSGRRGWITVVDAAGRRGPRTPLAGGDDLSMPALAAGPDGVFAVYGAASPDAGTRPRVEHLRCATSPPRGAPEQLSLDGAR